MADVVATVGLDASGFEAGMRKVEGLVASKQAQYAQAVKTQSPDEQAGGGTSRWERLAAGAGAYALAVRLVSSTISAYAKVNDDAQRAVTRLGDRWDAFKASIGRDIFEPLVSAAMDAIEVLDTLRNTAVDVLATVFSGGDEGHVAQVDALRKQIEGQAREAKASAAAHKLSLDAEARIAELQGRSVDAAKARAEIEFTAAKEQIAANKDLDQAGRQRAVEEERTIRDAKIAKAIADERAKVEQVQAERTAKLAQERIEQDRAAQEEAQRQLEAANKLSETTRSALVSTALDALKAASPTADIDAARRRLDLEKQIAEIRASAMKDSEKTLLENSLRRLGAAQDVVLGQATSQRSTFGGFAGNVGQFAGRIYPGGRASAAAASKVNDERVAKAAGEIRDLLKTFVNTRTMVSTFGP